ncbi:unnamed protein product [Ceutorhynchus assimilis]|uniref:Uncharacterized protein n=1 Tax=Ceutorhynchus assimilis TaxID=467358 RepID=A0A9N9QMI8_9CUCU|nr:unnamed protein product [Ceutorhynchus assimilis]
MIVLPLLLTTLVLRSTVAVKEKDVNLPDHRCEFMLRDRAVQNGVRLITEGVVSKNGVRLGEVENTLLPLARHHIIPYNIISDFLQAAIDRAQEWMPTEEIGEAFSFGQYLDTLVRETLPIIARDRSSRVVLEAAKRAALITTELVEHKFDSTDAEKPELAIVRAFFYWLPGNIVMGPSPMERRDDPEDGPDYRLIMIAQENSGERAGDVLRVLYHHMVAYRDRTEHHDLLDGTFRATTLHRIVELLTEVSTTSVYPFSSNDWESIMDPDTNTTRYRARDTSIAHKNDLRKGRVNYAIDNCDGDDKFKFDLFDIIANYIVPNHPELVIRPKP